MLRPLSQKEAAAETEAQAVTTVRLGCCCVSLMTALAVLRRVLVEMRQERARLRELCLARLCLYGSPAHPLLQLPVPLGLSGSGGGSEKVFLTDAYASPPSRPIGRSFSTSTTPDAS